MLHRRPLLPALALVLLAATPSAHATGAFANFEASYELDGQPLTLIAIFDDN
jgi:hypothetical protein